jgi:hypothetical protein
MVCMFWIVLMCWYQNLFLKNKKNIIGMHFDTKSYLKNTRNHTVKYALNIGPWVQNTKIFKGKHIPTRNMRAFVFQLTTTQNMVQFS